MGQKAIKALTSNAGYEDERLKKKRGCIEFAFW